jgi:hypothetical protein
MQQTHLTPGGAASSLDIEPDPSPLTTCLAKQTELATLRALLERCHLALSSPLYGDR